MGIGAYIASLWNKKSPDPQDGAVSMVTSTGAFGFEYHGGKAGIDLPGAEEISGGSIPEIKELIEDLEGRIEKRERELRENAHGLSHKEKKGYRTKLAGERAKLKEAEGILGIKEALDDLEKEESEKGSDDK